MKQSSPVMRSHSTISGMPRKISATFCSCPGIGRMRSQAAIGRPSAPGLILTLKPWITPPASSRLIRSATLGPESFTSRASSALLIRALAMSAANNLASIASIVTISDRRRFAIVAFDIIAILSSYLPISLNQRYKAFTMMARSPCHGNQPPLRQPRRRCRSAARLVRRQRRLPLSRTVLCGAAVSRRRCVGRCLVSHRDGSRSFRRRHQAMENDRASGRKDATAARRARPMPRGHEHVVLPGA